MRKLPLLFVPFLLVIALPLAAEERGLQLNGEAAYQGYTLIAPLKSKYTHLLNMQGETVHRWESEFGPGNSVYLMENGDLLRATREKETQGFKGGGIGGRIQRFNWDGELLWDHRLVTPDMCHHHDIEPLPNGNILVIAWERVSSEDAIAAGRDPETVGDDLWPDQVLELKPVGKTDAEVVWRWRVMDHLVQEHDEEAANYGKVADHPEKIDLNYRGRDRAVARRDLARLRALGYVGGDDDDDDDDDEDKDEDDRRERGRDRDDDKDADWLHTNGIAYSPELDQIALSVHGFNEIWVIDHSTTTEEAAGSTGGRHGKGGDLLFRWGNPQAYAGGEPRDQRLFGQHDARWVKGPNGAWSLTVFNNGLRRGAGDYSSVDEIALPIGPDGRYRNIHGERDAAWTYVAPERESFYSGHISGAQRLPNGHTLICSGEKGRIFEVTPGGKTVWEYVNPHGGDLKRERPPRDRDRGRGRPGGDRPPRGGPGGPDAGGRGPGSPTALFRAERYAPDYPGLKQLVGSD